MPPYLFFLLSLALAIQALYSFHVNFRIVFLILKNDGGIFIILKNNGSILMGIVLNFYTAFVSMVIFKILILPIHQYGMCFHLFVLSMISSSSVLFLSL